MRDLWKLQKFQSRRINLEIIYLLDHDNPHEITQ